MRKIIFYPVMAVLALAGVSLLTGCKKSFLNLAPKGVLIAQNTADYDNLLNNLTLLNLDGSIPAGCETAMGDDAIAVDPYFPGSALFTQRCFSYADEIYDPSQNPGEITSLMTQIYTFNKIINEVKQSQNGTDSAKNALWGEALADRAWCLFLLGNYYGKPYNASTASTDLSFPIITTSVVTANNFARPTVEQMYDTLIADLKAAIPLVNPQPQINLRMSKAAAEALLGKVLMFKGDYTDALPYLNAAFTDLPTSIHVALYDLNVVMQPGGTWGYDPVASQVSYNFLSPTAWTNTENLYGKQFINNYTYDLQDILVAPAAAALYDPADQRVKFLSPQPYGGGSAFPTGVMRRVWPIATQCGITLPDMYLLQAECNARLGNIGSATQGLVAFRQKRLPAANAGVSITDQDSLVRFIIDEREREFLLQGHRWFDMRRLSTDPLFASASYTHTYIKSDGSTTTYPLTADRMTLKIPPKVLAENPGFTDNP